MIKVEKKKVRCKECGNMNKYGWCMMKKRCFSEEERHIEKQCRYFFKRKFRPKRKKY